MIGTEFWKCLKLHENEHQIITILVRQSSLLWVFLFILCRFLFTGVYSIYASFMPPHSTYLTVNSFSWVQNKECPFINNVSVPVWGRCLYKLKIPTIFTICSRTKFPANFRWLWFFLPKDEAIWCGHSFLETNWNHLLWEEKTKNAWKDLLETTDKKLFPLSLLLRSQVLKQLTMYFNLNIKKIKNPSRTILD